MMMKCFGQVIETYYYDDKPWITIWDLEHGDQVAVRDRDIPGLKIGQLVSFERKGENKLGNILNVKKIAKDQLPSHLKPII